MERGAIAQRIPHGESMCMLDSLLAWDERTICCGSISHRRPDNPLCEDVSLGSICLVEFCAQAAALHSALLQEGEKGAGLAYLGAVKQLQLVQAAVEPAVEQLQLDARCEVTNPGGAIYYIRALGDGLLLLEGRIVLVQVQQTV